MLLHTVANARLLHMIMLATSNIHHQTVVLLGY